MPPSSLTSQQKSTLRAASRDAIAGAYASLAEHIGCDRWLGPDNAYMGRPISTLRLHSREGEQVDHEHLSEYIAASAPIHYLDACSYLGRAIDSHILGDIGAARHLAYYAELRSAASLLACEGVGIFLNQHFAIDQNGVSHLISGLSTHSFAWLALEDWAGQSRSVDLLSTLIQPSGIALAAWLDAFRAESQLSQIGSRWLRNWGLDLKMFAKDKEARNIASYRPSAFHCCVNPDIDYAARFIQDLWHLFEPSSASIFQQLDRYLLRRSLEEAYESVEGNAPSTSSASSTDFEDRIRSMIKTLSLPSSQSVYWGDFLTRRSLPDDSQVICQASETAEVDHPSHHIQVMSRAALLLRIAAGACRLHLETAGHTKHDLEFWWRDIGHRRGFWETNAEPDQLVDLWSDVVVAIDHMADWQETVRQNGGTQTPAGWINACSLDMQVLEGFERVGFWSLAI